MQSQYSRLNIFDVEEILERIVLYTISRDSYRHAKSGSNVSSLYNSRYLERQSLSIEEKKILYRCSLVNSKFREEATRFIWKNLAFGHDQEKKWLNASYAIQYPYISPDNKKITETKNVAKYVRSLCLSNVTSNVYEMRCLIYLANLESLSFLSVDGLCPQDMACIVNECSDNWKNGKTLKSLVISSGNIQFNLCDLVHLESWLKLSGHSLENINFSNVDSAYELENIEIDRLNIESYARSHEAIFDTESQASFRSNDDFNRPEKPSIMDLICKYCSKNLKNLSLANFSVSLKDIKTLCMTNLRYSLQGLTIINSDQFDDHCLSLILGTFTNLKYLRISKCNITDHCLDISENPNLVKIREIEFSNSLISDVGAARIAKIFTGCEHIDISYSNKVTSACLGILCSQSLPRLTCLNLFGCRQIDPMDVSDFLTRWIRIHDCKMPVKLIGIGFLYGIGL